MSVPQHIQDFGEKCEQLQYLLLDFEAMAVRHHWQFDQNKTTSHPEQQKLYDNRTLTLGSNSGQAIVGDHNIINIDGTSKEDVENLQQQFSKTSELMKLNLEKGFKKIHGQTHDYDTKLQEQMQLIDKSVAAFNAIAGKCDIEHNVKLQEMTSVVNKLKQSLEDSDGKKDLQKIENLGAKLLLKNTESEFRLSIKDKIKKIKKSLEDDYEHKFVQLYDENEKLREECNIYKKRERNRQNSTELNPDDQQYEEFIIKEELNEVEILYERNKVKRIQEHNSELNNELQDAKLQVLDYLKDTYEAKRTIEELKGRLVRAERIRRDAQLRFIHLVNNLEIIIEKRDVEDSGFLKYEAEDNEDDTDIQYHIRISADLHKVRTKISNVKDVQERNKQLKASIDKMENDVVKANQKCKTLLKDNTKMRTEINNLKLEIQCLTDEKQQYIEMVRNQQQQLASKKKEYEEKVRNLQQQLDSERNYRKHSEEKVQSLNKQLEKMENLKKQSEEIVQNLKHEIDRQKKQSEEMVHQLEQELENQRKQSEENINKLQLLLDAERNQFEEKVYNLQQELESQMKYANSAEKPQTNDFLMNRDSDRSKQQET